MKTDKAFVLSANKINNSCYDLVILTQANGRIAGSMRCKLPPIITAFGIARWKNQGLTSIYFEQITPSVVANFLQQPTELQKIIEKCGEVENFFEFYQFLKNFSVD